MTTPAPEILDETYKDLALWLRNSNATKDKKWLYTLMAWIIEHPTEKKMKIAVHINTILHHNQGYFSKYASASTPEYCKKYYEEHKDEYIDRNKKIDDKKTFVYNLYKNNALPELCTKYIQAKLDLTEAKKLCGKKVINRIKKGE